MCCCAPPPLPQVKTLEHTKVYDPSLPYGDRARGKTITVVNRSEVVGRPLAALLANDGARVLSADINGIVEYSKRRPSSADAGAPETADAHKTSFKPSHVTRPTGLTLADALAQSDVVVSAVPGGKFKVATAALRQGVVCVDIAGEKNFEADVTDKVRALPSTPSRWRRPACPRPRR